MVRRALANPVFAHCRDQAHQQVFLFLKAVVHGARHAHRQRGGGLTLQRQVGQHVLHQRLLVQYLPERRAHGTMVQRLRRRHAHARAGADHAVKARHRHHLDDGAHAPAFFADHPRQRAAQLGLGRCVGRIAHFFLQPQHLHRVFAAVRAPARQQEARQAAGRLRQHQERIAHGSRHKILVPHQFVSLAWPTRAHRVGACAVGAHIRAALLLGHRHADGHALFLFYGHVARVIHAGRDLGLPHARQVALQAQRGHGGEGHGDRAAVARLHLAMQKTLGSTGDVRARARRGPR